MQNSETFGCHLQFVIIEIDRVIQLDKYGLLPLFIQTNINV